MRRSMVLLSFVCLFLAGCGGRNAEDRARPAPRASATLITRELIERAPYQDAYELVSALRSNWLRPRGVDSFSNPGQVLVYRDDVRIGGVGSLRTMPTQDIDHIEFIDGIAASARWGLDHGNGVIFVHTRM